ncbi:MAG: carbohydrate ABC transporter permease, partial [Clostridiales bacterium]|nr:carbohydrate ABC transporter permease [Clostridiales bacterium]
MSEKALKKALHHGFLSLLAFLVLFPVMWIILSSMKAQTELFRQPLTLLPRAFTLDNYRLALSQGDFARYFGN